MVAGPESEGHLTGQAIKQLVLDGVDGDHRIIGAEAPHPLLFNVPLAAIDRFREQVTVVDLQFEGDPDVLRQAVWSCYQEVPVEFRGQSLYDPGAYPEPPLSGSITWRVTQPWVEAVDDRERDAVRRAKELMEKLRQRGRSD